MRSIVFCILTTSGCIVILYQVLKDAGEEVVVLCKCLLKREVHEFIYQCTGEWCTLRCVRYKRSKSLEQRNFCVGSCLRGEYFRILLRNVRHCGIKDCIEIPFTLLVPEVGY